eukprot:3713316-Heterocapsa_arctica.AAC.1
MAAEMAVCTGQVACAIMLDLRKAYEHIQVDFLLQQAIAYGLDMCIFRLLLMLYTIDRVIVLGVVATDAMTPLRVVPAGCSFADLMMRLALMELVTRVADSWAGVRLAAVVDDIQILSVGSKMS